jgi:hypothetical protein
MSYGFNKMRGIMTSVIGSALKEETPQAESKRGRFREGSQLIFDFKGLSSQEPLVKKNSSRKRTHKSPGANSNPT